MEIQEENKLTMNNQDIKPDHSTIHSIEEKPLETTISKVDTREDPENKNAQGNCGYGCKEKVPPSTVPYEEIKD